MSASKETPDQSHIECVSCTVTESKKLDKIDTVHRDEALKVLLRYDGDSTWTAKEEAKIVRKIDRRLLVILVLTFAIQFYDKFLFSHAAIFGMRTDLDLIVGNRYSMASSIFYLGYIAGAYPATFLAQRFPIHIVVFGMVFLWGICVLAGGFCSSFRELYVQRFFLGLLESGVSPVWMMVVGGWYTKLEQNISHGEYALQKGASARILEKPALLVTLLHVCDSKRRQRGHLNLYTSHHQRVHGLHWLELLASYNSDWSSWGSRYAWLIVDDEETIRVQSEDMVPHLQHIHLAHVMPFNLEHSRYG
ncbi:hypothetical protein IL306_012573 [Fusarium sp. DS 682]|nr:hypothetical protein IL306_012573 [Fusarium sp. DS 682]